MTKFSFMLSVICVLTISHQCLCQTQEFIRWQTLTYKNIPGNFDNNASVIIPFGVSNDRGRLFVSVPRRNPGVAAVLSTVELIGSPPYTNPQLIPYPNFDIQSITSNPQANPQKIVSVYRTRVDRCGFLWFADTGVLEFRNNRQVIQRPSLWAINLNTNEVTWRYEFPVDVVPNDGAGLVDVTVDDDDCQNVFVYLPDIFNNALVVVDTKNARSWRFIHNYLRANPFEGDFDVDGFRFHLGDGVFSIALSNKRPDGFKIAFFHPLSSHGEFTVSTRLLKDETAAARRFQPNPNDFRFIGYSKSNRGDHFFDTKNRVLFSAEMQKAGVSLWDPKGKESLKPSDVKIVAQNNQSMIYPACINMDSDSNLWVLSNRLPRILFGTLDRSLFNFNIFKLNPDELIRNSGLTTRFNTQDDIGIRGEFPNEKFQHVGSGKYGSSSDAIKFNE